MDGDAISGLVFSLVAAAVWTWYMFFGGARLYGKLLARNLRYMAEIRFATRKERLRKFEDGLECRVLIVTIIGKYFLTIVIILILLGWVLILMK